MPADVQAEEYDPAQSCDAGTNLSAITVDFMFFDVTHTGVSSTDGTWVCDVESRVLPLTSEAGGLTPALRYSANADDASASKNMGLYTVPHW